MGKNHACLISPPFLDSGTVVTKYIDVLLVAQNLTLNQTFTNSVGYLFTGFTPQESPKTHNLD